MPESELDRGGKQEQAFCVEFKGNDEVRWLEKWGPPTVDLPTGSSAVRRAMASRPCRNPTA